MVSFILLYKHREVNFFKNFKTFNLNKNKSFKGCSFNELEKEISELKTTLRNKDYLIASSLLTPEETMLHSLRLMRDELYVDYRKKTVIAKIDNQKVVTRLLQLCKPVYSAFFMQMILGKFQFKIN